MKRKILTLFAANLVLAASVASATLIDGFNSGTQSLSVSPTTPNASQSVPASSALGQNRDANLMWLSGAARVDLDINTFGAFMLTLSQGANARANASVTWDGDSTPGNIGLALGGGRGGRFDRSRCRQSNFD